MQILCHKLKAGAGFPVSIGWKCQKLVFLRVRGSGSCSVMSNFATPRTVSHQAALSMGFSRQEYWCGLPCSTPGDLPNPGIETPSPVSPDNLGITKSFGHLRHGGSPPPQIFTYILHKFLLVPDPLNLFYSPCKGSLCVRDPFFFPVVSCGMWDLNSPTRD